MYKSTTSSQLPGYSYFPQLSVWCGLFLVSEMSLYNILNKYEKIIDSTKGKQIWAHLKQTQIRCTHLKHHLSPPWTQKAFQHQSVTHTSSCHWCKWQIHAANGVKGTLPSYWTMQEKSDWKPRNLLQKISIVEIEQGHYWADANKGKKTPCSC